jgi:hypothetical protein
MKNLKICFALLFLFNTINSSISYTCEMKLSELVNKSEVSEKFTNFRYLIKSGSKWFYMSQDNNCWITIRYVKNSEDREIHNIK